MSGASKQTRRWSSIYVSIHSCSEPACDVTLTTTGFELCSPKHLEAKHEGGKQTITQAGKSMAEVIFGWTRWGEVRLGVMMMMIDKTGAVAFGVGDDDRSGDLDGL